jgi:hypothetical protein
MRLRLVLAAALLTVAACGSTVAPTATTEAPPDTEATVAPVGLLPATPDGACPAYNRLDDFGSVPSRKARLAAITAAKDGAGQIIDYYTGAPVVGTPDVDHVVPLAVAWQSMCHRSAADRTAFGNYAAGLVPTSASINRGKSDQTPATWSPADRTRSCAYGTLYESVAKTWDIPVSDADDAAVKLACGN